MTGDGELQEGPIWEAVMFAGQKHLDNLCVLVDRNNGQLDISSRMVFPMPKLEAVFESFDWKVHSVDATSYDGVYAALEAFRFGPRNGKPTAIICHSTKGHGALSDFLNKHKVVVAENLIGSGRWRCSRSCARAAWRIFARTTHAWASTRTAPRFRMRCWRVRPRHASRSVRLVADRGAGGHPPRSAARQADSLQSGAPAQDRPEEGVQRRRHRHRRDEGLCARFAGRLDRFRSGHHQRSRSRRRRRGSAARAQRRRRRSQHDAARRGVRRARLQRLDQHLLSLLGLEGDAPHRRGSSGAAGIHGVARRLVERRPRPRSHDARHRVELRDPHQRRHPHGQRRRHWCSTPSPT